MIQMGQQVLVKQGDRFVWLTVLEVAASDTGKSIYRVTLDLNSDGYWVDGSKVFLNKPKTKAISQTVN